MISRLAGWLRPGARNELRRTPSLDYQADKADRKRDAHLGAVQQHRQRTGAFHPEMPTYPSGSRPMSAEESQATRHFRERYHAKAAAAEARGFKPAFDALEYKQTYREEAGRVVPNQRDLIVGTEAGIPRQSGLYPAGTRVDIHSHPNIPRPLNDVPSEADHRAAHRNRTNALQRPGTRMAGSVMYDPVGDAFYGYSGAPTGRGGGLEYHRLYDPFPAPGAERSLSPAPDAPPAPSSNGHVTLGHGDPGPIPPSPSSSSLDAGDGH